MCRVFNHCLTNQQKSSLPQVGSSKLSFYPWFPNGCPVRGLQCGGSAIQRVQRPRELISCESADALNPRKSPPINGVLHLVLCIIVAAGNAQCGKIHWLAIPASTLVSSWNHGGPIQKLHVTISMRDCSHTSPSRWMGLLSAAFYQLCQKKEFDWFSKYPKESVTPLDWWHWSEAPLSWKLGSDSTPHAAFMVISI